MLDALPLWFVAAALAVLGAIWGSFAGALCHRWPLGESIIGGRSHCDDCQTVLRAHELVPILSYLSQQGKCRTCGARIALSNLKIELACALAGLVCVLLFAPIAAISVAVFCWLLVPLIVLDWQHNWLPDALLFWLAAFAFVAAPALPFAPLLLDRLIGGAAGFVVLEGLRRGYMATRGIDAMGTGDPKMFGVLGLWLGWQSLPILLLAASVLGLADFARRYVDTGKTDIRLPLGSYLGAAAMALIGAGVV